MAKRSVKQGTDYRTFKRTIIKQGGTITHGGKHDIAHHPDGGSVPLPRHSGDYPTGTRESIKKALLLLGFAGGSTICILIFFGELFWTGMV